MVFVADGQAHAGLSTRLATIFGLRDDPLTREASPPITSNGQGAVTRDVRDVTRAIEGLARKLDNLRREYERRGRF